MANDSEIFATDGQGRLLSTEAVLALTIPACERICGTSWTAYPDAAPRLMAWLVPVLLLIANLQYAEGWKEKAFTVLHLLGDPIHSIWSLLSKVEMWRHSCEGRDKNTAVVAAAITELVETLDLVLYAPQVRLIYQDMFIRPGIQPTDVNDTVLTAASELTDCRVNESIRAWASIILYVVQIIAAFVPKFGETSSPSGGKIGLAILLSWLVPIVLLSNAAGDFTSRRQFRRIMLNFMERVESQGSQPLSRPSRYLLNSLRDVSQRSFTSQAWSGAIYTYRPSRIHFRTAGNRSGALSLPILSAIPILLAFGAAFRALYSKPTYFNCRHILVVCVLVAWLLSPLTTRIIETHLCIPPPLQWQLVMAKDAFLALPIMALIIGSSCGLFTSCWCWSGVYTLGLRNAAVYLSDIPDFNQNNSVYYPAVVGTCVGLQVGVFVSVRWTYWRAGFDLLNWSEQEKEAAFQTGQISHRRKRMLQSVRD